MEGETGLPVLLVCSSGDAPWLTNVPNADNANQKRRFLRAVGPRLVALRISSNCSNSTSLQFRSLVCKFAD
jgi:hypothetical protein